MLGWVGFSSQPYGVQVSRFLVFLSDLSQVLTILRLHISPQVTVPLHLGSSGLGKYGGGVGSVNEPHPGAWSLHKMVEVPVAQLPAEVGNSMLRRLP